MTPIQQNPPTSVIKVTPVKLPSAQFTRVDARLRQLVADVGVAEIKKNIQAGIFKSPTGALANSIRGEVDGTGVVWWSDLPHAGAQEHGVRPHAMWYLLNKTIPLRGHSIGGGTVVFRRATLASFMRGSWFHKGMAPKHFMKKGIDTAVNKIPELLRKAQEDITRNSGYVP